MRVSRVEFQIQIQGFRVQGLEFRDVQHRRVRVEQGYGFKASLESKGAIRMTSGFGWMLQAM